MTGLIHASEMTARPRRGRQAVDDELRRRNAELAALHETALDLITRRHVADLLQAIVERAGALLGTRHGDLYLLDASTGDLVLRVGTGVFAGKLGSRLRPGEGFVGRVFETGRRFVVEDYQAWEGALPEFASAGIRAAAAVPLVAGGEVTGVLGLVRTEPGQTFGPEQGELLGRFGNLAAIALERTRLAEAADQELAQRRAAEDALRAAEERYRTLVEQLPAIVYLDAVEPSFMSLYISPRVGEILGYTPEELQGDPAAWPALLHPDDRDRFLRENSVRDALGPFASEYRLIAKDGRTVWVRDEWIGLPDEEGRPRFFQGVLMDITERHRLEENLRQAAKMEAIGRLAGGIAHDFNNLLTAIGGYANLLLEALPADDDRHEDAEAIRSASDRAASLVRQLLAFSRRQAESPGVLDVNEAVASVEGLLRRLIGEDIALTTTLGAGVGRIREDRSRMEQVLVNLAVNARDAMPNGGTLTIETADEILEGAAVQEQGLPAGRYVRIDVRDTGSGMDEEVRAHLFEPFYTTKQPGLGTGLGLATVYAIVEAAAGRIDVTSAPGAGTAFTIWLSAVDEPAADAPAEAGPAEAPGGRERVLVVEDEEAVRALAAEVVGRAGYTVLTAASGSEGIRMAFEADSIDLVISDVIMPGIRGRDATRAIRAVHPGARVLYVSGYADERTLADLDAPMLAKPFAPRELLEAVRAILDGGAGHERAIG